MNGGLQYEVHRMPPGMRDKVVAQVLEKVSARAEDPMQTDPEVTEEPCDTCLRWDECNGVDKENCPLWGE